MRLKLTSANSWAEIIGVLGMILAASQATVWAAPPQTSSTTVFAFGYNSNGQLGLGPGLDTKFVPTPIITTNFADKEISQVSAGRGLHSLMLANDGTVFSFGANMSGRTGLGTTSGNTPIATPIITSNLSGKTITEISTGAFHSLLLANDGTVFSFGTNDFGTAGQGTTSGNTLIATPIITTNMGGKMITQASAGLHSLLLADDGTVFSFGWNTNGQTGLGTQSGNTLIATPIITTNLGGKRITQVAAGGTFSLLLADDGSVFSFGWYLSTGTFGSVNKLIATPIDATNLAGKTVTQVAAGNDHALLLTEDGTVFAFGNGADGKTGQGTDVGGPPIATPIISTNLAGKTITQLSAGFSHSLLLAADGTVFSFGANDFGAIGIGPSSGDAFIATPINMTNLVGQRVVGISAGDHHNLLLTVPIPEPQSMLLLLLGTALPSLVVPRRNRKA
jgi:alpha-tubulin suppressor-like RCC1 family protein